jgi:2-hydroxychromene-2-carboxylate isomerase
LIETALEPGSGYPDYWQRDLRRYRETLLVNLARPEFFVPVELKSARSVRHGYRRTREFLRMSSECLKVWPTLWKEVRRNTRVA